MIEAQKTKRVQVASACALVVLCVVVGTAAAAFYAGVRYGQGTRLISLTSELSQLQQTVQSPQLPQNASASAGNTQEQAFVDEYPGSSEESPVHLKCEAGKTVTMWYTTVMNSPGPGEIQIPQTKTVVYVNFDGGTHVLTPITKPANTASAKYVDLYATDDQSTLMTITQPYVRIDVHNRTLYDKCIALD